LAIVQVCIYRIIPKFETPVINVDKLDIEKKPSETYLEKFKRLVEIMATLRGDKGCPWDKQQDHRTLMPYVIEEAYEVIEAIEEEKSDKIAEELGDLLLQIVFQAQVAKDNGEFTIAEVLDHINDKLIRRHPHIFGDVKADTPDQVLKNWEEIKLKEKGATMRKSLLDGIPSTLPALLYARRLQERAAGVGFDWESVDGVLEKAEEEIQEMREAIKTGDKEKITDELGDLLFVLVNVGRWLEINPEESLRKTSKKFIRRFSHIEQKAKLIGKDLSEMDLYEMEDIWQSSKENE
jgi:tetrapyrrole methylase family protein / MazG family protein